MADTKKTTLYLSPSVRKALKRRVITTEQTMSEYANQALAEALTEDLEDLEAIEQRREGKTESLDDFLAGIKADGLQAGGLQAGGLQAGGLV